MAQVPYAQALRVPEALPPAAAEVQHYARFFSDPGMIPTFRKTCWLGVKVAAIAVILGYPIAYRLASLRGRTKYVVAVFFAVPLLMR